MILGVLSLAVLVSVAYMLFINFNPSFGGDLSEEDKSVYEKLENFEDGVFKNRFDVPKTLGFGEMLKLAYKYFTTSVTNDTPSKQIPIQKVSSASLKNFTGTRLIWFGHSTFLLQNQGKNILIDPMFGAVPAPADWLGNKRFFNELPITINQLPTIDYVVISHDHYDHLDYQSIRALRPKVKKFLVPLGLGVHLKKWGIADSNIVEMNWWEKHAEKGMDFICTPAQHFSGRKLTNGKSTLWASWVIQSASLSLYFSGDSGYDIHFQEIGSRFGPFDIALIECGQYNKLWAEVHLFPEETVQAGIDLKAKKIIPIHWGAFKLALHPWNEPPIRITKEALKRKVNLEIPKIGTEITLAPSEQPTDPWWLE